MAHANVALNFNAFLEKTKLKDDGSNYENWVRNLRIILIAARKAYVLDAPLGEAPIFPAEQDIMNLGRRVVMITPWFSAACFTA